MFVASILRQIYSVKGDTNKSQTNQQTFEMGEQRTRDISQTLRTKDSMTKDDIENILGHVINRKRFAYTSRDIGEYLLKCLCVRKLRQEKYKSHYTFAMG